MVSVGAALRWEMVFDLYIERQEIKVGRNHVNKNV